MKKNSVLGKHPILSLGNFAEGIAGLFAIGAGILVVLALPFSIAAWMTLSFAITTTFIAFASAWKLYA